MPRFPRAENDLLALAIMVALGLEQAAAEFPHPPFVPGDLRQLVDEINTMKTAAATAERTFREIHVGKDERVQTLAQRLRACLRYIELTAEGKPEKLSQFGWGPPRQPVAIEPPGEVRDIHIRSEGDTWLILDWNPPADGGRVAAYKVQRRKRDGGMWEDIATITESEALLSNQPRGTEFEFRVLAVNRAGNGQPSATVSAVL